MTFHRLKDFTPSHTPLLCRRSAFGTAAISVVAIALVVAVPLFEFPPHRVLRFFLMTFLALFALITGRVWLKLRGPQNWLLCRTPDGVALKFRSALNAHFPPEDQVIVVLQRTDIACFRKVSGWLNSPTSQNKRSEFVTYLEIGLREPSPQLESNLQVERNRKPPGTYSTVRYGDNPIRLIDNDRTIRVEWRSSSTSIRPKLDAALSKLSAIAPIEPAVRIQNTPADDDKAADDAILDLTHHGQVLEAVKLARQRYGFSLSEAKAFVAELSEHG